MAEPSPTQYKGYLYRTQIWQLEDGGQWAFNVSLQKKCGADLKRATGLVREFEYFNDATKAAAAAKLWAENYIVALNAVNYIRGSALRRLE